MSLTTFSKNVGRLGRMPGPVLTVSLLLGAIGIASYTIILGEWMLAWTLGESDWRWISGTFFITAALILFGSSVIFAAGREAAGGIDGRGSGKNTLSIGGHGYFRSMDSAARIVANAFALFFVNLILFILYNLDTPTTEEGIAAAAEGIRGMRIVLLAASIPVVSSAHKTFMYAFETQAFSAFLNVLGFGGSSKKQVSVDRM